MNCHPLNEEAGVKHDVGTSKLRKHGGWKLFYQKKSGYWPEECQMEDCPQKSAVGAHVLIDLCGRDQFILPTCQSCNQTEEFSKRWTRTKLSSKVVRANPHNWDFVYCHKTFFVVAEFHSCWQTLKTVDTPQIPTFKRMVDTVVVVDRSLRAYVIINSLCEHLGEDSSNV